jgi:molybdopterin molybdotransferase
VFALPGNPAASFVGFEVLGVPVVEALLGRPFAPRRMFRARWGGPAFAPYGKRRFRPVRLDADSDGALVASPVPWKSSGDPFSLSQAQALAEVPEGGLAADGRVSVIPLDVLAGGGA